MGKVSNKNKRIRTIAILGAVAVLAIALGVLLGGKISGVLFSGQDLFTKGEQTAQVTPPPVQSTSAPIVIPTAASLQTGQPTASPEQTAAETQAAENTPAVTADPYEELAKVADTSMMNGIVNIMFIGVDYEAARIDKNWAGKSGNSFHSDVMIVCAVNFNENRVDLISLPRDTYANIPGVKGVYKLNAALNCGTDGEYYGLFCKNGEGFDKVCEAAEWMLGGIDVDYYYAVTMESVKQIVDIVGGVWYNLEGDFDNGGRYYKAGFQFMDGQACLDYMRVRKAGHGQLPTGDSNRVNRQKNMMVTIFKKMKEENMVLKVPEILAAFDGALFTNCTPEQTAALALFGYKLDPNNIGAHSMGGDSATLFHWNFIFTRQSERVKLIKEIYGVDVKTYPKYSLAYGRYQWCKMLQDQYMDICDPLKSYVQALIDEDDKLPKEITTPKPTEESTPKPTKAPDTPKPPEDTPAPDTPKPPEDTPVPDTPKPPEDTKPPETPKPPEETKPAETDAPPTDDSSGQETQASGGYIRFLNGETRRYTDEQRELFSEYKAALKELKSLYTSADKEASKAANHKSNSLNSVSNELLDQMIKVQDLAIAVAKTFDYNKVKNIGVTCYPNQTNTNSPWALNFWDNKKYNAVKVNFN
jgi:LCP family protein required for cell wall assembly